MSLVVFLAKKKRLKMEKRQNVLVPVAKIMCRKDALGMNRNSFFCFCFTIR